MLATLVTETRVCLWMMSWLAKFGVCTMELPVGRRLPAQSRVLPGLDIARSGTRKEEGDSGEGRG